MREIILIILKAKPTTCRGLFSFRFMLLEGKKSLELLKITKGLKVILSILVKKIGRWLFILKKQLKLLEDIQIWVRIRTLRSLIRVPGVSDE